MHGYKTWSLTLNEGTECSRTHVWTQKLKEVSTYVGYYMTKKFVIYKGYPWGNEV